MTAFAINYVANPISVWMNKFMKTCEVIGYARASHHLASMGYYEEAKTCMLMIDKVKAERNENLSGWV